MWSLRTTCSCFFFFSSRRRHTRCYRDWSSDVCSSDLRGADVLQAGLDLVDVLLDLLALLLVGLGYAQEHLGKSRHAVAWRWGEIGPSPERFLIGRQKDRQRPAA